MNTDFTDFFLSLDASLSTQATVLLSIAEEVAPSTNYHIARQTGLGLAHSGDSALWLLIGGLLWYPFAETLSLLFAEGPPHWFAEGLLNEAAFPFSPFAEGLPTEASTSAKDLPFRFAKDLPFRFAEDLPFRFAEGLPFRFAEGLPFRFAKGLPFRFAEGLPFRFAEGLLTEAVRPLARDAKAPATKAYREVGKQIILITLITGAISAVLKRCFHRARPEHDQSDSLYLRADRHSFPSGHAVRVGTLMVILGDRTSGWGRIGLGLWAAAVCAARVMLGAHFASDVLIGLLIGMSIGVAYRIGGTR